MAAKRVAGGTNSGRAPKAQAGEKNKKKGEHAKNRIEQRPTNAKSDGSEEGLYVFVLRYYISDVQGDAGPADGSMERHRSHRIIVTEPRRPPSIASAGKCNSSSRASSRTGGSRPLRVDRPMP